jgi:hypothetical protein
MSQDISGGLSEGIRQSSRDHEDILAAVLSAFLVSLAFRRFAMVTMRRFECERQVASEFVDFDLRSANSHQKFD